MKQIKGIKIKCATCGNTIGLIFVDGKIIKSYCNEHIPELNLR